MPHVPVGILEPNADYPCSLISGFRNNYCRLIKITLKQVLTPLKSTVSLSLLPNRCSAIENILTRGQRKGWYKDHQLFERPQAFFREKPLHLSFFLSSSSSSSSSPPPPPPPPPPAPHSDLEQWLPKTKHEKQQMGR